MHSVVNFAWCCQCLVEGGLRNDVWEYFVCPGAENVLRMRFRKTNEWEQRRNAAAEAGSARETSAFGHSVPMLTVNIVFDASPLPPDTESRARGMLQLYFVGYVNESLRKTISGS